MFYLIEVEDYVRVEPKLFGLPTTEGGARLRDEMWLPLQSNDLG